MEKLQMLSKDKIREHIESIKFLFPNVVTEVLENGVIVEKIDFDMLKQELSDELIGAKEEKYQFNWPDKKKNMLLSNSPIAKTLRPKYGKSKNFSDTENIYIEGDNVDALKLLQETYLGKVKMIYIDPPYNTGNDFIYNDDFAMGTMDYRETSGEYDEDGNRLVKNLDSNGRFHTDWLNMMYVRLRLAKDLLADNGCIFISIDDNEMCNLKKMCDEIFGAGNFFTQIIVQSNKRGQTYKQIAKTHEYILVYTKSIDAEFNELEKDGDSDDLNLSDNIGKYNIRELRNRNPKFGRFNRPNLFYSFWVNPNIVDKDGFSPVSLERTDDYCVEVVPLNSKNEESCWRWGNKLAIQNLKENTQDSNVVAKNKQGGGYNIYEKYRKTTYKAKTIWDDTEFITEKGTVELGDLGLAKYFDFPKPLALVKRCIQLGSNDGDIVLDFFSGSATTAHALLELNKTDNVNRKFILIQLPEELGERGNEELKTICDVGEKRISIVEDRIMEDSEEDVLGMRVFTVDSTNMKDIFYNPSEIQQSLFDNYSDNIKEDRTPEDLLFQVMLDLGVLLSSKIEEKEIAGKKVFNVAEGFLVACFDNDVTEETIKAVAQMKPYYAVFRDSSMANDNVATNFEQIFMTYSPDTVRKVL